MSIIHPRMLSNLTNFYPSTCEIQSSTESRNALGEVTRTWSTLSGHGALPCAVSTTAKAGELRTEDQEYVEADFRIALRGHYPTVTEEHRAVVGALTYNILRVRHDQMSETTYLDCEVVT